MNALHMLPEPVYVASNYTKHPMGYAGAYLEISRLVPRIYSRYRVVLFSPIAHGHGFSTHGDFPIVDKRFWRLYNAPFIEICGACLVAKLSGWQDSEGIADEITDFRAAQKTVLFIEPDTLEISIS